MRQLVHIGDLGLRISVSKQFAPNQNRPNFMKFQLSHPKVEIMELRQQNFTNFAKVHQISPKFV